MTGINSTLLNDEIKDKFALIGLAVAGLKEKLSHSEIEARDIEVIELLIGQSGEVLEKMIE